MKRAKTMVGAMVVMTVLSASFGCDRQANTETARSNPDEGGDRMRAGNEPSTNAATAQPGFQSEAVRKIADARCDREERCGEIGEDEDYTSRIDCRSKIRSEWAEELNEYECPGGIVMKEFDECLEEIRNEDCANPFDTLGRIIACRSGDICKAL